MLISWTRDICSLTDFAQERTFSHKLRPKDFSSLCILWCKLSSFGVKKVLSHNLHLWFFVPKWILMCFNKSALSMRDFLQWTQGYDFTPRWTLMWRFNEVLMDICLLHWKHLYDPRFTSVCVFLILRILQMYFDIHCICYLFPLNDDCYDHQNASCYPLWLHIESTKMVSCHQYRPQRWSIFSERWNG